MRPLVVSVALTACATPALAADFLYPTSGRCTAIHSSAHPAIDVDGAKGEPVVAARGGRVVSIVNAKGGATLRLEHESGYVTVYALLATCTRPVGATVRAGEAIGTQADHLHFEIQRHGARQTIPARAKATLVRGAGVPLDYPGIGGAAAPLVDLAKGRPASASSNWSADYDAPKAFDAKATTGWSPTGADTGPWIQVDLGAARDLARVELVTRQELDQPSTRRNFEIWASNNADMSKGHVVLARQSATTLPFKSTVGANVAGRYRYVAAVKTANEYFYVTELRVLGKGPATPLPPPPPVPAVAPHWQKAGIFVWHAGAYSTDIHGDLMTRNRFAWVTIQIHDGMTVNAETEAAFASGWIDRLKAKGILVGGWGVNREEPEREARLAAQLTKKWGLAFYIADAELEYKYTTANGSFSGEAYGRSARFVKAFRAELPDLPAGVSSFGNAALCDIDWAAWRAGKFVYLPQTYLNDYDIYDPAVCADAAVKLGWPRSHVFPTIGIWGGGATRYVDAAEYCARLKAAGTKGFSVYLGEQMPTNEWSVLGAGIASGLAR